MICLRHFCALKNRLDLTAALRTRLFIAKPAGIKNKIKVIKCDERSGRNEGRSKTKQPEPEVLRIWKACVGFLASQLKVSPALSGRWSVQLHKTLGQKRKCFYSRVGKCRRAQWSKHILFLFTLSIIPRLFLCFGLFRIRRVYRAG